MTKSLSAIPGLLIAATVALCVVRSYAQEERPPNLIIILTDDQGYQDLGCYGGTTLQTPRIDALAKEGTRLTDFYVAAPLCSPSRAALLTGCYPQTDWHGIRCDPSRLKRGLSPEEVTIAEMLKQCGYATGCIGKWHLGFVGSMRPTRQGFDFYYGLYHNLDHWETKFFEEVGGTAHLTR